MRYPLPLVNSSCCSTTTTCCTPRHLHSLLVWSVLHHSPTTSIPTRTKSPLMAPTSGSSVNRSGRRNGCWPRITPVISRSYGDRWSMMSAGFARALTAHRTMTSYYASSNGPATSCMCPTCCITGGRCQHQQRQMRQRNHTHSRPLFRQSPGICSAVTFLAKSQRLGLRSPASDVTQPDTPTYR